jgi:hypothetical protein
MAFRPPQGVVAVGGGYIGPWFLAVKQFLKKVHDALQRWPSLWKTIEAIYAFSRRDRPTRAIVYREFLLLVQLTQIARRLVSGPIGQGQNGGRRTRLRGALEEFGRHDRPRATPRRIASRLGGPRTGAAD